MFHPFVDQLSIFHLLSMTYCRRRVNEPFEGATMNCNLVICPAIWCFKQSWLGGRASDRHVSRNKLYLSTLTPAETFCPYGVHTNFSTSRRMSSGTSQPHLRAINAEQKASDSIINPKGFVFPFPLKALMLLHPVKIVWPKDSLTFLLSQLYFKFSDIDDSIVATGSCHEKQETTMKVLGFCQ